MTIEDFKGGIMNWLRKYNFNTVDHIEFHLNSSYHIDEHVIRIGVYAQEESAEWFVDFLSERGLEWEGIPHPILQFLHELGHNQTVYDFSDVELLTYSFLKQGIQDDDPHQAAIEYWSLGDELAANLWAIDFINNSSEALIELCELFVDAWNELVDDICDEADSYDD